MKHWYWIDCPVCCKTRHMLTTKKEIKQLGFDVCSKCYTKCKIELDTTNHHDVEK